MQSIGPRQVTLKSAGHRQDACPGCGAGHVDLSEAGLAALCGLRWPEEGTCDYLSGLIIEEAK